MIRIAFDYPFVLALAAPGVRPALSFAPSRIESAID